jgi:hypothetical protein
MKKKILSILITILAVCTLMFTMTACNNEIDDANVIMSKAVEKIDYVSEMMFAGMETNDSSTLGYSSTNSETSSTRAVSKTTCFSSNANDVTSFSTSTTIPSDITYSELWCGSVMERQIYVNYVYNVVDYLLQNRLIKDNRNHEKFKTGEIIYGKANKTINKELNEFYSDPTIGAPTMAIRVDKTHKGIHFIVDWDWRGDKIVTMAPMYNTIIMVDGDIEYDQNKHKIKKISMTWQFTKDNEILMATVMDFNKNEFYFMECYRQEIWEDCSSKEQIVQLFNDGELTYEKMCEYPYSGIMLVKSNITLSVKDLKFTAMWKQDSDLNGVGLPQNAENDNETRFANLYADVYKNIRDLKIRDESELMNLSNGREISYMNTAAEYGLNKIEYVVNDNGVHFLYLQQSELNFILSKVEEMDLVKKDEEFTAFVDGVKGSIRAQGDEYIGKLGTYNGVEYKIEYVFKNTWWETDWSHHCETFYYSIADGINELVFERKNGNIVNVDINPPGDESDNIVDGMHFTINTDRKSYTLSSYDPEYYDEKVQLEIPATYKNRPVTKIADNAFNSFLEFESLTVPESITYIGRSFVREIEKLNYLGTVNQWVEITFSFGNFMSCADNFYIKGDLLTSANITAKRINDWAFFGCKSLTSVCLSDDIEYIGAHAFWQSSISGTQYGNAYYIGTQSNPYKILLKAVSKDITDVELHADTEIICGGAFSGCVQLANVSLNSKLNKIGYTAFDCCPELTKLTIPASVKAISAALFADAFYREKNIELIFENTDGWWDFAFDEYTSLSEGRKLNNMDDVVNFLTRGNPFKWLVHID